MPRGKSGRTATKSNVAEARKETKTTSRSKSKNLDPNLTTTMKLRRSPRNHRSSETATKEHPISKKYDQSTIDNHITTNKDVDVRNTTTLRSTTKATVTSKAAAKSSQKSKNKAKAVVQSNRRTSKILKRAGPVSPSSSSRHIRPGRGSKIPAKSKQGAGRELERSASNHRTEPQTGRIEAIERGTQHQFKSKSITRLIPVPIDNAETLHATEPQVEPVQEDHCASDSRQQLTKEALEELARGFRSIDALKRNRSAKKIAARYSDKDSEDGSSQESVIDSQERFNRKWGYVPPLDEETTRIIEAIIKNPARAETMVGIGPENPLFLSGLRHRNVLSDPSTHLDPREEEIKSISLDGYLQETQEQETSHEELWKSDKAKCTPDSSEALYQRTLMINLVPRHLLIYQFDGSKEQIFDFSVEEPWGCLPMPSRHLWNFAKGQKFEAKLLTQPKPDFAVCFKREAVMSDRMWKTLPDPTKGLACFENRSSSESRIFHFLVVEAKKAMFDLNSPQALHQCLNSASQALHNMFEFFRDAGPEHEQIFYDKVRFFSVVANRNGIIVRIHRAVRMPDDANMWELVMPDQPGYRLEFEFRQFQRIGEHEFSRKRVLNVMKKILKYATDDLSKMINAAASKLVQNLEKDIELYLARGGVDFYSYGLPNPKSVKSSRRTSVTQSTIGERVHRKFQTTNLESRGAPSAQSIASEQTISRLPHQPVISSRLATTARKRGAGEIESDELEDMRAPNSPVRKRLRPSCSNSGLSLSHAATADVPVGN